ncbi:MAG: Uma2 family endonuclease [Bacteroidota bacterium]
MRIPLNLSVLDPFTDQQLYEFCTANKELRIERDAHGQLFIMSPTGTETSFYNYDIGFELGIWNRQHQLGRISESNGGYLLPDGSMRAPDIAWISHERLNQIEPQSTKGFMKTCPDFVIELMSPNDSLPEAEKKMNNWLANGVKLGWLIDPEKRLTSVYQATIGVQEISFEEILTGGEVLPGFELDLKKIFRK